MRKILIFFSCLILCSCTSTNKFLKKDSQATKQVILAEIPKGTPITDAKNTMEKAGFKCSLKSGKFGYNSAEGEMHIHPQTTFISCDSGEKFIAPYITKGWHVAIVHNGTEVLDIFASTGLSGL